MDDDNKSYRDRDSDSVSSPEPAKRKKGFKSIVADFQRWSSNKLGRERGSSYGSSVSLESLGDRNSELAHGRELSPASPNKHLIRQSERRSTLPGLSAGPSPIASRIAAIRPTESSSSVQSRLAQLHDRYADLSGSTSASADVASLHSSTLPNSSSNNLSTQQIQPSDLSNDGMEKENVPNVRNFERNVEEYMDAKSGSEDSSTAQEFSDNDTNVRKIKLASGQNVGFESLPVQFVNKATKAGFVFNILVIGETGVGKSTLINSLFNYDFKLTPGDYSLDHVTLDRHTFHLEEGSVRLQLTVIETKGYGDQLNMADSWHGIVDYIDKQYEAYFQEESQVNRRLSEYKDTRVHVCLFLLAPTGSTVRALDIACMKQLANKVNIIPVIARGDSLTKKEMENFKRRINEELRLHKINIYKFPEDDTQVADLNRKMNNDVPFAVVGSSDVCEVAGHKTRARVYPWGIVDIENEAHCDFTRFREALLRVNMDHLMQTTHLKHYELYRDRRMTELGYGNSAENKSFIDTITQLRQSNENEFRKREEETRASFVNKVREKEFELKERERELHSQFESRRADNNDRVHELETQRTALLRELEIFNRVKSELINHPAAATKPKKK